LLEKTPFEILDILSNSYKYISRKTEYLGNGALREALPSKNVSRT